MIPEHTQAALDRYVNHRIAPGGFLTKVLCNDLFGAVGQADSANRAALPEIVVYIYNELPANCWGSQEIVWRWLEDRFYERVAQG